MKGSHWTAELLAKTPRGLRQLSLEQHSLDTERAAALMFREGTRWHAAFQRFFKLSATDSATFLVNLRVAALFHDLGKANAGFQKAVSTPGFSKQSLRHEHLSAILLAHPSVHAWLGANPALDRNAILAAVLSHHLKAAESGRWRVLDPQVAAPTPLFFDHEQVQSVLHEVAKVAGLSGRPTVALPTQYDHPDWEGAWDSFWQRASQFRRVLRNQRDLLGLVLALKAGVIAADSVASALFREGVDAEQWIEEVAHSKALSSSSIRHDILNPRTQQLATRLGRPFEYQQFQEGAATIGRRGLLLAACGAGKTLAAWRWAESVARDEAIGRVIFLYPTRGTATEGFRDYVAHAPESVVALVHGTARYELMGMQSNVDILPEHLRDKDFVPDEAEQRLFSLGLWPKRYFSATVDQFLSFMEHGYGGMCLLPALADAAVIFDEVHSYDTRMWTALVSFLEHFDVPTLCMTATLSPTRRSELTRGLRSYPSPSEREQFLDLEDAETKARYIVSDTDMQEALEAACAAFGNGMRVLWVVNTVQRCQELAVSLRAQFGIDSLVYHSRFRLEDRQTRHRETVDAFRASPKERPSPAFAVTTQVCEMSLDLDADVLVTEHAPVSSMVQRFGRAHRHARPTPGFRAQLFTYPAPDPRPYERAEIAAGRALIASLAGRPISQRDLALGIEQHAPAERESSGASRFIEGGFFATPGRLREDDGGGAVAILDSDVERFLELARLGEPTDGLRLNVPRRRARPSSAPVPPWLSIAEAGRYDNWLGFRVGDAPGLGEEVA